MSNHANTGPSSLKTFDLCPHFVAEPEEEDDFKELAVEGSMLHEVSENFVKVMVEEKLYLNPIESVLIYFDGPFQRPELTTEQAGIVKNCIRQAYAPLSKHPNADVYLEQKMDAFGITWGTADLTIVTGPTAILRDWKFGRREVYAAERNLQLYAYALGVFHRFTEVMHVNAAIYQPRLDDELGTPYTFTRAQIPFLAERVSNIVVRREMAQRGELDPPQHLVSDSCEFCHAIGECPRVGGWVTNHLDKNPDEELKEIDWPEDLDSPETRGQAMECVQILEKFAGSLKGIYTNLATDGLEFDGFLTVNRNGAKTIKEDKRVIAFQTALNALMPGSGDHLRSALGDETFTKLGGAVSFTASKLPGQAQLALAKFISKGKDSVFLKKKA